MKKNIILDSDGNEHDRFDLKEKTLLVYDYGSYVELASKLGQKFVVCFVVANKTIFGWFYCLLTSPFVDSIEF